MTDEDEVALEELPQPERETTVAPSALESDGDNPNAMEPREFNQLVANIKRRGWVGNAIVTDTNGVIADGEHRWRAAKEVGLDAVPVKQYDLTDSERRLLRQELNKIRGSHDIKADAREYERILENSGTSVGDLARSLATNNDDIRKTIDQFGTPADDVAKAVSEGTDPGGETSGTGEQPPETPTDTGSGDPTDGVPDEFPDVGTVDTEHECPSCGYEW